MKNVDALTTPAASLSGKNALVTGAGRRAGIGAAVSLALARRGANVFTCWFRPYDLPMLSDPDKNEGQVILAMVRDLGVHAGGTEMDLSDADSPDRLFDLAEKELGAIDILVNNAVYDRESTLEALTPAEFDTHYSINLRAPAFLCREFFLRHDGRDGGRIINMTSGQGLGPMPDQLPYAATKGGLEALTISLAPVLAKKNITINAVDPGPTDTGWMNDTVYQAIKKATPLGRVGLPADAANLIAFLAGPESAWITGQLIRSRGGI